MNKHIMASSTRKLYTKLSRLSFITLADAAAVTTRLPEFDWEIKTKYCVAQVTDVAGET